MLLSMKGFLWLGAMSAWKSEEKVENTMVWFCWESRIARQPIYIEKRHCSMHSFMVRSNYLSVPSRVLERPNTKLRHRQDAVVPCLQGVWSPMGEVSAHDQNPGVGMKLRVA